MITQRTATRFTLSPIAGLLMLWVPQSHARDYFDPDLLSLAGGGSVVSDLSVFETSGKTPAGTYLVTLIVNQNEHGQYRIQFSPNQRGDVMPELTPLFLSELGVNIHAFPAFKQLDNNKPIDDLTTLIPDARLHFDFQQQRLELSIPQIAMLPDTRGHLDPRLWDQGMPALLMNYTLNGGRNSQEGQGDLSSSEQKSLYLGLHGGLNWDAWRIRSDMTYIRNETSDSTGSKHTYSKSNFTNTYLQRDIQAWRSEILVGESSTGNDVFDSIPFRGVKLSSNEDMLPFSMRGFAPVIQGIAQSNAQVTISQNGNVVYQTYVAPGYFRINDMYQSGNGGDLNVTVTETDGSIRTWTQSFSALPVMMRPNGFKYEITAGRYHGGVTVSSREADFALATLIYGLPHDVTLYGGSLFSRDYLSMVAGAGISLGVFGALSADISTSTALMYDERESGQSYRLRYSKSLLQTGTSLDLTAYRYSTRHYYSFSDFNNTGYRLSDGQAPWALERERSDFQIRISQQLGKLGALYLSGSRSDYWGSEQVNNNLSVGYNGNYRGVSFGLAYSIDRIKSNDSWPQNRQLSFNLQIPFSLFSHSSSLSSTYASYQMTHDNTGQVQQQIGVNGTALDDRLSWTAMQGRTNKEQGSNSGNTSTLNLGWQGSKGMVNMGYSRNNTSESLNLNSNGGFVIHPHGVTFSRQIGTSAALVSAPGASGVNIMNGGVRTDSWGYAVIPYLSPYQRNNISLDPSTLPDDVDLSQSSVTVHPTKGAVVLAKFATRTGYQALLTLKRNGVYLPFGTMVTLKGTSDITGIVGDTGQAYLNGLPEKGSLIAVWGRDKSQRCGGTFNLKNAKVDQNNPIRLMEITCSEVNE